MEPQALGPELEFHESLACCTLLADAAGMYAGELLPHAAPPLLELPLEAPPYGVAPPQLDEPPALPAYGVRDEAEKALAPLPAYGVREEAC